MSNSKKFQQRSNLELLQLLFLLSKPPETKVVFVENKTIKQTKKFPKLFLCRIYNPNN